jgi:hypothetical protein
MLPGAIPRAMEKPSPLIRPVDLKATRGCRFSSVNRALRPEWFDAESRAFLERSSDWPSSAKILQVILITAMVVAVLKGAWILAFHV